MRFLLILLASASLASGQLLLQSGTLYSTWGENTGSGGSITSVGIFATNLALLTSAGYTCTNTISSIPPNSMLALLWADESDTAYTLLTSSRPLQWNISANANASSSGNCEIFTAFDADGGTLFVTNTQSASLRMSSLLVCLTNANGMPWVGKTVAMTGQATPNTNFTTLGTNSDVLCVLSDWAAKTGAITYRSAPVTNWYSFNPAPAGTIYRADYWYLPFGDPSTAAMGESAPSGQSAGFCALEARIPLAQSGTCTGCTLIDFEAATGTVTADGMTNGTKGSLLGAWTTQVDPPNNTQGATPSLMFTNSAKFNLSGVSFNVNGTSYSMTGTNGMRHLMQSNNCVVMALPGLTNISVGFFWRFGGGYVDYSPRTLVSMIDSAGGSYQIFAISDDASSPTFYAHSGPGGAGVGNSVAFKRNQWYWVTLNHVNVGNNMYVSFYDPNNNYALLGTSTLAVSGAWGAANQLKIGCTEYGTSSKQWSDFDNFIINTNGVFPLKPF